MTVRRRHLGATHIVAILVGACVIIGLAIVATFIFPFGKVTYSADFEPVATETPVIIDEVPPVEHLATPNPLKAVYFSSWAAGNKKFRQELFALATSTEINAVVIDIKDYTGHISFPVNDPALVAEGAAQDRIPDIQDFIKELHQKGIYVIGRISSFQDSFLVNKHPEWAVKTTAGGIWGDYKGVKWLDAGAQPVWDYLVAIGKEAYSDGFDELNFDYIRYPSDGNMQDVAYSWSDGRTREQVMRSFFSYLQSEFQPMNVPISADLFGLTTSASGDLGIGQNILDALPYFDFVAPMVYPSHFAHGFIGYEKPAEHPYEVIKYSMEHAIAKAEATTTTSAALGMEPIASTTPQLYARESFDKNKLRPWLQAFDLGAIYTPAMVRAQMQAAYDTGLTSWMLWDAGSVYNQAALMPKGDTELTSNGTSSSNTASVINGANLH